MFQLSHSPIIWNRFNVTMGLWLIGLSLAVVSITSLLPTGRAGEGLASQSSQVNSGSQAQLMREGTRIVDQPANCRSSGEQLLIDFATESEPLVALENLAAQRILKAVMDDAGDGGWVINGQITEFKGHNYILLNRVNRQPKNNPATTLQN